MPRGKVTSEMLKFVADTGDVDVKEAEKNTAAKFTLIEPEVEEEKEPEEDDLVQSVHNEFAETMESSRPNFKFTLLLVTLFVAVNVGLITLLDDNKKSPSTTNNDGVPVVSVEKQAPATTNVAPEKPVLGKAETVEKPVLAPTAPDNAVTLQKPIQAAPAAAAKEKPANKQSGSDLLSIIGKY